MEDCFKDLSYKSVNVSFTRLMAFVTVSQRNSTTQFFESSSAPFTELTSGVFNSSSLASVSSDALVISLRIFSLHLGSVVSTVFSVKEQVNVPVFTLHLSIKLSKDIGPHFSSRPRFVSSRTVDSRTLKHHNTTESLEQARCPLTGV